MWCSNCQQDVPAVAHAITGRAICPRCQQKLSVPRPSDTGIALDEPAAAVVADKPPLERDDWQMRQRARHLSRELGRTTTVPRPPLSSVPGNPRRFDPPQDLFDRIERITAPSVATSGSPVAASYPVRRRSEGGHVFAWLVIVAGTIALAAGLGAIAWSLAENRPDLWNPALGVTLAGQGTLIFGLVLVLMRLWRTSRYAAGKLQDVHARLGQLQQTTDALSVTRAAGGAPAFYAELARGANPQMLLANLKGQVDQLAARFGA